MNNSVTPIILNFANSLTEPSTTLNFGGGAGPIEQYLSMATVVERLIVRAEANHKLSQDAIETIVVKKFQSNELLPELEAAAVAYA